MDENNQKVKVIVEDSSDDGLYSNSESSTDDPVSGSNPNNVTSDAVIDDTDEFVSGTVENLSFEESPRQDISFNVALLFVASMIVGLLIFGSLSRKWHA